MKKILILLFISSALSCNQGATNKSKKSETDTSGNISLDNKKITVYTTANSTNLRFSISDTTSFEVMQQPKETDVCVFVEPSKTFQTFLGIGGAFTDASAETYYKLPESQRQSFLKAYFDTTEGIGYTLGRTNMNSCDFSSYSYTYVMDNDKELNTFNIDQDRKYKIPLIKEAIHAAGGKLLMYISPWSPPAWMKDNNSMLKGGRLKEEFYPSWAEYYVKYIKALENDSIPIWGLSVQNEPMATQTWESCIYTAEEEAKFIKESLGPALYKAGMREKKLIIWDHNRDLIYQRASTTLKDPEVAKYVWGIGFHWYETWTGSDMMFDNLRRTAEAFPDKHLIFTEGCKEKFSLDSVNNWSLGERYGMSMINDFNAGTVAWTDWNILLDEKGGPNHVGNFCFAPVHANTHSGKLIFTNAYYYIGHFSKFIRPGARRVSASTNRTDLLTTAFLNTDGKLAVVVMNQGPNSYAYNLWIQGQAAKVQIFPRSIQTVVLQ